MALNNKSNILVDILSNELIEKDGKKRFTQAHLEKSFNLINQDAYPISKYKLIQIGANTQSGGLKEGLIIVEYHGSLK